MSNKKRKKDKIIKIQDPGKGHIVIHDDKSKLLTKDMRYIIFFVTWLVGFFVIMIYAWKQ